MEKLVWNREALRQPIYSEAMDIALSCSKGATWIVGGFLYRNVAAELYGGDPYFSDIDICVRNLRLESLFLPDGWSSAKNRYGGLKLQRAGITLDIWPITQTSSIVRRGLMPTIENLLTGTPLAIQSIAYNVLDDQLTGEIGIQAILDRTVKVNDSKQAEIYAERKGLPIEQIIRDKAEALGFTPILPEG